MSILTPHPNKIALQHLALGEEAVVCDILSEGAIRRRLMDLGLVAGTKIRALFRSPSGDPVAYEIRGAVIALREEQASCILVEPRPAYNMVVAAASCNVA